MKIQINWRILGGSVTAGGLALMPLAPSKEIWWMGFAMTIIGPITGAIRNAPAPRKRRKKPKPRKKKP